MCKIKYALQFVGFPVVPVCPLYINISPKVFSALGLQKFVFNDVDINEEACLAPKGFNWSVETASGTSFIASCGYRLTESTLK